MLEGIVVYNELSGSPFAYLVPYSNSVLATNHQTQLGSKSAVGRPTVRPQMSSGLNQRNFYLENKAEMFGMKQVLASDFVVVTNGMQKKGIIKTGHT